MAPLGKLSKIPCISMLFFSETGSLETGCTASHSLESALNLKCDFPTQKERAICTQFDDRMLWLEHHATPPDASIYVPSLFGIDLVILCFRFLTTYYLPLRYIQ